MEVPSRSEGKIMILSSEIFILNFFLLWIYGWVIHYFWHKKHFVW